MKIRYLTITKRYWNAHANEFSLQHPEHLNPDLHPSWGLAHIPERELQLLPPSFGPGQLLIDIGCGRGHDAVGFAAMGYKVIGIDISEEQIHRALRNDNVHYLVGNAEQLPFPAGFAAFVVSDHGAFDHSRPERLVAEVARVLRPGGVLIICTYTALALSCFDSSTGRICNRLMNPYPIDEIRTDGNIVMPHLGISAWVRKLRAGGFDISRIEEPLTPPGRDLFFDQMVDADWAARWPVDLILVARKVAVRQNGSADDHERR